MPHKRSVFLLLLCMSYVIYGQEAENKERSCTIHVLLERSEAADLNWVVTSEKGYRIEDIFQKERSDQIPTEELTITVQQGALLLNGRRLATRQIKLMPLEGEIVYKGNSYPGALYLLYQDGTWYLVNGVDLEEYVACVLRSESWPGWPLETNKVFAVILRSYAVAKLLEARGKRRIGRGFLYDVRCTNMHQTYKGSHKVEVLHQATRETRGMVLAYKEKPIMAMYDSCCGGIIPADITGIDFKNSPYLKRTYACTYCASSKLYAWKVTYSAKEMVELMRTVDERVKVVQDLKVVAKDKAGLVQKLSARAGRRHLTFDGRKAYTLFKAVKSYCFSVVKSVVENVLTFVFKGRGFGHHLGLCQWGAHEMVKQGMDYTNILHFYYPGTRVMKLKVMW